MPLSRTDLDNAIALIKADGPVNEVLQLIFKNGYLERERELFALLKVSGFASEEKCAELAKMFVLLIKSCSADPALLSIISSSLNYDDLVCEIIKKMNDATVKPAGSLKFFTLEKMVGDIGAADPTNPILHWISMQLYSVTNNPAVFLRSKNPMSKLCHEILTRRDFPVTDQEIVDAIRAYHREARYDLAGASAAGEEPEANLILRLKFAAENFPANVRKRIIIAQNNLLRHPLFSDEDMDTMGSPVFSPEELPDIRTYMAQNYRCTLTEPSATGQYYVMPHDEIVFDAKEKSYIIKTRKPPEDERISFLNLVEALSDMEGSDGMISGIDGLRILIAKPANFFLCNEPESRLPSFVTIGQIATQIRNIASTKNSLLGVAPSLPDTMADYLRTHRFSPESEARLRATLTPEFFHRRVSNGLTAIMKIPVFGMTMLYHFYGDRSFQSLSYRHPGGLHMECDMPIADDKLLRLPGIEMRKTSDTSFEFVLTDPFLADAQGLKELQEFMAARNIEYGIAMEKAFKASLAAPAPKSVVADTRSIEELLAEIGVDDKPKKGKAKAAATKKPPEKPAAVQAAVKPAAVATAAATTVAAPKKAAPAVVEKPAVTPAPASIIDPAKELEEAKAVLLKYLSENHDKLPPFKISNDEGSLSITFNNIMNPGLGENNFVTPLYDEDKKTLSLQVRISDLPEKNFKSAANRLKGFLRKQIIEKEVAFVEAPVAHEEAAAAASSSPHLRMREEFETEMVSCLAMRRANTFDPNILPPRLRNLLDHLCRLPGVKQVMVYGGFVYGFNPKDLDLAVVMEDDAMIDPKLPLTEDFAFAEMIQPDKRFALRKINLGERAEITVIGKSLHDINSNWTSQIDAMCFDWGSKRLQRPPSFESLVAETPADRHPPFFINRHAKDCALRVVYSLLPRMLNATDPAENYVLETLAETIESAMAGIPPLLRLKNILQRAQDFKAAHKISGPEAIYFDCAFTMVLEKIAIKESTKTTAKLLEATEFAEMQAHIKQKRSAFDELSTPSHAASGASAEAVAVASLSTGRR